MKRYVVYFGISCRIVTDVSPALHKQLGNRLSASPPCVSVSRAVWWQTAADGLLEKPSHGAMTRKMGSMQHVRAGPFQETFPFASSPPRVLWLLTRCNAIPAWHMSGTTSALHSEPELISKLPLICCVLTTSSAYYIRAR